MLVHPGYLAIHLLGLLIGTILLPPTPFDFRRAQNRIRHDGNATTINPSEPRPRQDDETAKQLSTYALLWWSSRNLLNLVGLGGGGVSRRLVCSLLTAVVVWTLTNDPTRFRPTLHM